MIPVTWLDPLLALLLLLPAACLAVPLTLGGQLEPEPSAAGWWVLLQLAPALLLFFRRPKPAAPLITLYAAFTVLTLALVTFGDPTDTFQARRAALTAIASLSAFTAGAALGPRGRRVLTFGLAGLSIAFTIPALLGVTPRMQGALQNSGATSEAAVLGALAALAWWLDSQKSTRWLAALAAVSFGMFAGAAPVIAGVLVFAVGAAMLWFARKAERRTITAQAAVFALAVGAGFAFSKLSTPTSAVTSAPQEAPARGNLGGVAVRLAILPGALAMWSDAPWLGVGPGQFRAAFPPYRSERERTLSNLASPGRESEVEHAHDDYLTMLDEVGLLGAASWLTVLGWLALFALRALRSGDLSRTALALVVLGGIVNAALRAPLTFNPASASLFFACAGALIAQDNWAGAARSASRAWLPLLGFVLLAASAPHAWRFVRHGHALRLPTSLDMRAALTACPDSPGALELLAVVQSVDDGTEGGEEARKTWKRLLELRPRNFEAQMQAGVLAAEAEDGSSARLHWLRALELAPERTDLLRNLLLLEARLGADESFAEISSRSQGVVARAWAVEAGANELLDDDERAALRLWSFAGADWVQAPAQALYDRSREDVDESEHLRRAWEMLAHLRWAREHAQAGDFASSVRSYRQALRLSPRAASVGLELAAALWSDGKQDEARATIGWAGARPPTWTRLAPWAADVLRKAGLFAGS
ncbi:MAG TPA: O-antigen ligase family protein [Planctomycetota bacterium]|nr:O-antigen ligase family protein [Planctomycetota bacterium]